MPIPDRIIKARAPIRICDNGGWTDTWFAGHGAVFNIAVSPYAETQIAVYPAGSLPAPVILSVIDYGDRYPLDPSGPGPGRHPLLEAAIRHLGLPAGLAVEISLHSDAPGGASTGTSAAVTVALLGALAYLNEEPLSPQQAAAAAHYVETGLLGRQCGIQDQLCSAYGGINWIEMHAYPQARVERLAPSPSFTTELEQQLSLVYLGRSHDSSSVHERVIAELEDAGPDCPQLEALRHTARLARQAVEAESLPALGQAMLLNTEAQAQLNPHLVGSEARAVIATAQAAGATGWKVNGAGGEGGSLTLLGPADAEGRRRMLDAVLRLNPAFRLIPIRLDSQGLQVWEE